MRGFSAVSEFKLARTIEAEVKLNIDVVKDGQSIGKATYALKKGQKFNYVRVYEKNKFDDLENCLVIVVGYRK